MPRTGRHLPRHRADAGRPMRRQRALGVLAAGATVLTVSSGIVVETRGAGAEASTPRASLRSADPVAHPAASAHPARAVSDVLVGRRSAAVSRSEPRSAVDPVKKALVDQDHGGQLTATEDLTGRDPRTIARAMLPEFGFDSSQFSCLDSLYVSESGWDVHADNPTSSAYGIPQALPGEKMASAGADWADSAVTQIRWGLGYIRARYGTPCSAWSFKQGNNWY